MYMCNAPIGHDDVTSSVPQVQKEDKGSKVQPPSSCTLTGSFLVKVQDWLRCEFGPTAANFFKKLYSQRMSTRTYPVKTNVTSRHCSLIGPDCGKGETLIQQILDISQDVNHRHAKGATF